MLEGTVPFLLKASHHVGADGGSHRMSHSVGRHGRGLHHLLLLEHVKNVRIHHHVLELVGHHRVLGGGSHLHLEMDGFETVSVDISLPLYLSSSPSLSRCPSVSCLSDSLSKHFYIYLSLDLVLLSLLHLSLSDHFQHPRIHPGRKTRHSGLQQAETGCHPLIHKLRRHLTHSLGFSLHHLLHLGLLLSHYFLLRVFLNHGSLMGLLCCMCLCLSLKELIQLNVVGVGHHSL